VYDLNGKICANTSICFGAPEHKALVLKMAQQSIDIKNDKNLLPLSKNKKDSGIQMLITLLLFLEITMECHRKLLLH
jgi:hypothetical protein